MAVSHINGHCEACESTHVSDVMHVGLIHVSPMTTLADVAKTMVARRIHCVIVSGAKEPGESHAWGIVSSLDLMRATAEGLLDNPASDAAVAPGVCVDEAESITHAAQLMAEHEVGYLVVVSSDGDRYPTGIVSSLDIAGALTLLCSEH